MSELKDGDKICIRFTLSLEDGTVVDATEGDDVMTFALGDGEMIDTLESHIKELTIGDEQTFLINPDEGFGYRDEDNLHEMQRSDFPEEIKLEEGLVIGFDTPAGDEVPGVIMELIGERVIVDFNHPLAGRNLAFRVELVSVNA
ncbi:MAG: FKBP-type peptidyl-prolyl cis-trans isomerase [Gammaproteobacteria bacterium]|nr:FKBP-type peptidyl-prolyl cis-trans isomerase [Gammaproteobacteria bacterium]